MTAPRRLTHRQLAAALWRNAGKCEVAIFHLAQMGVPGTGAGICADAFIEASRLVRRFGGDRQGAEKLVVVAELREAGAGPGAPAWETTASAVRFHLLHDDSAGPDDPLERPF